MAVTLSHYRFGIDELAEATHGWHAAEDANPAAGALAMDTTFLLRFTLQCDATLQNNVDPEFQYRKNGGTWTNLNTTSTNVRAVVAAAFANGDNTTNRLSGTGTFEASSSGCTEDGVSGGATMDIVASGNAETECSMQLRSADLVGGDLLEFRLTRDGGTLLDTYSVVPALIAAGAQSRTAGTVTVTTTAPTTTVTTTVSLQAGTLTATISAPTAVLDAGGPQSLAANAPVFTTSAPTLTILGEISLPAGNVAIVITSAGGTVLAETSLTLAAPVATISAPGAVLSAIVDLLASAPVVALSAPASSLTAATSLQLNAAITVLTAPTASLDIEGGAGAAGVAGFSSVILISLHG